MVYRNNFCLFVQPRIQNIDLKNSVFIHWDDFQFCAGSLAQHLPRNDVGMMFQIRNNDLVILLDLIRQSISHQINAFGCSFGKNNFVIVFCINEPLNLLSGKFHFFGCNLTQSVDATVNVRVDGFVIFFPGFNDRQWFLRSCCIVQINQRFSVHLLIQNWKLCSYVVDIKHFGCRYFRCYNLLVRIESNAKALNHSSPT